MVKTGPGQADEKNSVHYKLWKDQAKPVKWECCWYQEKPIICCSNRCLDRHQYPNVICPIKRRCILSELWLNYFRKPSLSEVRLTYFSLKKKRPRTGWKYLNWAGLHWKVLKYEVTQFGFIFLFWLPLCIHIGDC